ncbi:MAG: GNAT family N-acetyltransferase [Bacteroidota bacterium]
MKKEKLLVRDLITEAFNENKSVNYVIRQDAKRIERIHSLINYSYAICKRYGDVIINEDQNAAALVSFPHHKKGFFFSVKQDLQLITQSIGIKKLPSVLKREAVIKNYHPKDPFCHLWYIGVAKIDQRKGVGTHLLQAIIQKYDALGMPIYLETSMEENVAWYKKNGFQVYEELKDFGFVTYLLRRIP